MQVDKSRPTWDEEVSHISSQVLEETEDDHDVCLLLHSYAGLPGCEAVNRIVEADGLEKAAGRGLLRHVVYFAAHHFPEGFVVDTKQFVGPSNGAFYIDDNDMAHHADPRGLFFSDIATNEEAQPYVDQCTPFYYIPGGGATTSDKWRRANRSIVCASEDKAVPPDFYTQMWKEFEEDIQFVETGHSPFMVKTKASLIADLVVKAAA